MLLLEMIAAIVSAFGVWLTTQRNMLCWPLGLVSISLYIGVFWHAKLYSNVLLQLIYAVLQVYGWWHWSKKSRKKRPPGPGLKHEEIAVRRIPYRLVTVHLLIGAVGSVALGYLMSTMTEAALPWLDSTLTNFSLIAQFWTARQYIANWWLWIAVNIVYVGLYEFRKLHFTAVLYIIFIILSFIGLRRWRQALNLQSANKID